MKCLPSSRYFDLADRSQLESIIRLRKFDENDMFRSLDFDQFENIMPEISQKRLENIQKIIKTHRSRVVPYFNRKVRKTSLKTFSKFFQSKIQNLRTAN